MKKVTIITGAMIIGIIIPIASMSITSTRNLILGLAPEEAIVQLADKIDENRLSSDVKIQELQTVIDSQQAKLAEQQQTIDSQKTETTETKLDIQTTNVSVAKQKDCAIDINRYCVSDSMTDPAKFKKFLDGYEEDFNKEQFERYKEQFTEQFNNCQKALACK